MKHIIYLILLIIFASSGLFSQITPHDYDMHLKDPSTSDVGNTIILSSILIISPTFILEDKKAYFGLSKELSFGVFPYGRAELDYTYIFRSERTSAVHLTYNLDIPLMGNQSSIFTISPGFGYYTDFTRKGFLGQVALGVLASTGFNDKIVIHPNIKFRKVFMNDNFPGVFEISLGVGFGFYAK